MFYVFLWSWACADQKDSEYYGYYNSFTCALLDCGFYDPHDCIDGGDLFEFDF